MKISSMVIKVGSNLLSTEDGYIDLSFISTLAYQVSKLINLGIKVLMVSSGAVLCGAYKLGVKEKPKDLVMKQALSSIGQAYLMHIYDQIFSNYGLRVGQVLLTIDILKDADKFNNAKRAIEKLFDLKVVPIINENDAVAVSELIFGDNDFLAVYTAYMIEADIIVMFSSAGGLLDDKGNKVPVVNDIEESFRYINQSSSAFGTGGMRSKMEASRIASLMGIPVIITDKEDNLLDIINMKTRGTFIVPSEKPIKNRKKILTLISQPKGIIYVDEGAAEALRRRKSLLPAGITYVEGYFNKGDTVNVCDKGGYVIARGKTNFSSEDIIKIKGKKTEEVKNLIKNSDEEVIHADNMVVFDVKNSEI